MKIFKARGIKSLGSGSDALFRIGTEIVDGLKPAIGKRIALYFSKADLAFLLDGLATYHREAFLAVADAIRTCDEKYGVPKDSHGDFHHFSRSNAYRDAASMALGRDNPVE